MSFIRYHVITRADLHLVRATREVASRIINLIWWHHEMETFSALLALCEGKPPVTGWFPPQRSVTRSFDVCFDLRLNKRLSKQSTARCFDTPSCSLWRHCYEFSLISKWICFFKKVTRLAVTFKWCGRLDFAPAWDTAVQTTMYCDSTVQYLETEADSLASPRDQIHFPSSNLLVLLIKPIVTKSSVHCHNRMSNT